jgi:nitroreductase
MPEGTDLFEIIHTMPAMRRLKPDPVPDELIRKVLLAGQAAVSGGNTRHRRFLALKDQKIKKGGAGVLQAGLRRGSRTALPAAGVGGRKRIAGGGHNAAAGLNGAVTLKRILDGVAEWATRGYSPPRVQ